MVSVRGVCVCGGDPHLVTCGTILGLFFQKLLNVSSTFEVFKAAQLWYLKVSCIDSNK